MNWLIAFQPFSYPADAWAFIGERATTCRQKKLFRSSSDVFVSMPHVTKISARPSLSKSCPPELHAHRPNPACSAEVTFSKLPSPLLRYKEFPIVWAAYAC